MMENWGEELAILWEVSWSGDGVFNDGQVYRTFCLAATDSVITPNHVLYSHLPPTRGS